MCVHTCMCVCVVHVHAYNYVYVMCVGTCNGLWLSVAMRTYPWSSDSTFATRGCLAL